MGTFVAVALNAALADIKYSAVALNAAMLNAAMLDAPMLNATTVLDAAAIRICELTGLAAVVLVVGRADPNAIGFSVVVLYAGRECILVAHCWRSVSYAFVVGRGDAFGVLQLRHAMLKI